MFTAAFYQRRAGLRPRAIRHANTYHCRLRVARKDETAPCPNEAFDLISIGGGSGGLACAQRAAEYGAKTAGHRIRPPGRDLRERGLRPEESHVERGGRRPEPRTTPHDYGFDVDGGRIDWAA